MHEDQRACEIMTRGSILTDAVQNIDQIGSEWGPWTARPQRALYRVAHTHTHTHYSTYQSDAHL